MSVTFEINQHSIRYIVNLFFYLYKMSELTLKRKRSGNFSSEETELLLDLALSKKAILENKQSNAVSWKEKEKTWKNISDIFNSKTTGCVSTYTYKIIF